MNQLGQQKETKKGKHYKKYIAAASVAVMSFGALGVLPTLATTNPTAYKIASMIGIEKDLENYTTVVNQPVSQQGITIGLGEVVYDKENNKLIVTTYMTSNNPIQHTDNHTLHNLHERVYINGEELNTSSSGYTKFIDEKTVAFVTSYNMKEVMDGSFDMTVWVPQLFLDGEEYRDSWKFEFSVDGDQLAADTQVVDLDANIQLATNSNMKLVKYTSNVLGQNIHYMFEGEIITDFFELRGEDNLGNPVVFEYESGVHGKEGIFTLIDEKSNLSSEATQITLKLYTSTLVGEGEQAERVYNAIDTEIVIDLATN